MTKTRAIILFFTFICFMAWIVSDIFRTPPSVEVSPELTEAQRAISPTFDKTVMDKINQINKERAADPAATARPASTPSPSPTASGLPTINPQTDNQATSSASPTP